MTQILGSGRLAVGKPRQRILFFEGFWWYFDPGRLDMVRLDPLFLKSRWRVEQLSKLLGVGKRTFVRVVDASLGITTKLWLRQIRIVAASHLLREDIKIGVIGKILNIGDEADFAREFKKLMGVTPSQFRKSEYSRSVGYGIDS